MNIGIIDADLMDKGTRHPNLALMKIAGYFKDKGHDVKLIFKTYDEVRKFDILYMSKVFSFTKVPNWVLELENIKIGGTGFFEDGGENLPCEIEHYKPYYDLYKEYVEEEIKKGKKRSHYADYLDYSIGFTTRGCFRKCSFCVNKKYDSVQIHSKVDEFLDEKRPLIYLWDDNILAYSEWKDIICELQKTGRPFQFRQGIDLRLMTDEKARVLNSIRYHGDFIFAFDHLEEKELIVKKVQLWKRYSSKVCKMYVLCGYNSQDSLDIENAFERIAILMKYGSIPYIMRYEDYKTSKLKNMYIELARWCNQPQFFKKMSFREFCQANQDYKKNKDTNCNAYQAMIDFEQDYPEIAKKYFDLKFEKENIYIKQYGYGRKYSNKPQCYDCKNKRNSWTNIIQNNNDEEIIKLYFTKEIDILCLDYSNSECEICSYDASRYVLDIIRRNSIEYIIECIKGSDSREPVTIDNIPQYSSIKDAFYGVVSTLKRFKNEEITFEDMGFYLEKMDSPELKTSIALKKYGENHSKLACLLDLVQISKNGNKSGVCITKFGELFSDLSDTDKKDVAIKLCLRIPIIQNRFVESCEIDTINRDLKILSENTQIRRRSSVINMVKLVISATDLS